LEEVPLGSEPEALLGKARYKAVGTGTIELAPISRRPMPVMGHGTALRPEAIRRHWGPTLFIAGGVLLAVVLGGIVLYLYTR
jgi:hypothetical protein